MPIFKREAAILIDIKNTLVSFTFTSSKFFLCHLHITHFRKRDHKFLFMLIVSATAIPKSSKSNIIYLQLETYCMILCFASKYLPSAPLPF